MNRDRYRHRSLEEQTPARPLAIKLPSPLTCLRRPGTSSKTVVTARFHYSHPTAEVRGGHLTVSFSVRNVGRRRGAAVPEVYVGPRSDGWEAPRRLAGWSKIMLAPGGSATVSIRVDPRLLAVFDPARQRWQRAAGTYQVWVGESSADAQTATAVRLPAWSHAAHWNGGVSRSP